jgi:hypothetical protein
MDLVSAFGPAAESIRRAAFHAARVQRADHDVVAQWWRLVYA